MDISSMQKYKPKERSRFRIFCGKHYYIIKKKIEWLISRKKYTKPYKTQTLEHFVFKHKTPLYRQLKDVDMWYQYNKVINLKIALKYLQGIIIEPNETFSFWKLVGNTTKAKGYVDAMILSYGHYKAGIGGGLCQLTNLIYWMTLHTPLTVVERYRHSYDVFPDSNRTQPFGSGATCLYNYRDLEIRNDTPHPYQLILELDDLYLKGEFRTNFEPQVSYEVYEKEASMTHEYWGSYMRHNIIFRRSFDIQNQLIADEFITENHALMMYEPFIEPSNKKLTIN